MKTKKLKPGIEKLPEISIGMAATSGIFWTIMKTISTRVALLVGQLVLAKLLAPEDFGILGLAYTVTTFFGVLTNVGIDQVMQQRKVRMHLWSTQALIISVILSTAVAIAMSVYAPVAAKIYQNPQITELIWIIALSLPISALSIVPQVNLQAMMKFKFLASYGTADLIVTQVLMVIFAWSGFGCISFVLPTVIMALVKVIVFWRVAPLPLRPLRLSKGWNQMLKRGSGAFGTAILTTCIGQGDYVTLGILTSAQVVGIYYFAFKLAAQPMIAVAFSFTGVLRPALIALKSEPQRQCEAALKTATLLGLITVPLCFLQAAVAGPGLKLLFGDRWLGSIPIIQILSLGLPLDAVSWAAGCLLEARGQFGKSFKYQLITAPIFFALVVLGALAGSSIGVAIGVTIYYAFHPIFYTIMVFSREGIKLRRILACFYIPTLLGILTIGGAYALSQVQPLHEHLLIQIILILLLGGGAYLVAVREFSPTIYKEVLAKLLAFLKIKPQLKTNQKTLEISDS